MKIISYPLLDDDGKRKMLPGIANFGSGSYEKEYGKHTGILTGKKIGKIYKCTRFSCVLNKKVINMDDVVDTFGFPIKIYEN